MTDPASPQRRSNPTGSPSAFTIPDELIVRVPQEDMRATVEGIFAARGMSEPDAVQAADVLMYADLRGIDSHGVSNMFPIYEHWFESGLINPQASPRVIREAAAVATIDDDGGLGLATGPLAMDLAIAKAAECGIGAVSVANGRHYGAAAYHAHRAVEYAQRADGPAMIGVSLTIGGLLVVPTFGAKPMVGLNPIAVAVGAGEEPPFIFDASMSSVAGNKIRIAKRLGSTVPAGWITDEEGNPLEADSEIPDSFFMLPTGGTRENGSHKGYGLAVVVDVLSGILAGEPPGFMRPPGEVSHHFLAYRVDAFCDPVEFTEHMQTFCRALADTPPASGHDRVLYAGLAEHEIEIERRSLGIPYHRDVVAYFRDLARTHGVASRL